MIDKLDLRLPVSAGLTRLVSDYTRPSPFAEYSTRVRPAHYYAGRADLRHVGIDALLHLQCKSTHGHDHKLEILDVGKKSHRDILSLIEKVTPANPQTFGIMRIDLTADVREIPVSWAREHVRFKFKRSQREYGEIKFCVIGKSKVETITAGNRPNVFRIYDKVAESKVQFRQLLKKQSKDSEPLVFEHEFGFREEDTVTRFERQCGGALIPPDLATFGRLQRAVSFNPFNNLEIVGASNLAPLIPEQCDGIEYYAALGMQQEQRRLGMQGFRKQLNQQTKGNGARTMQRYGRFLANEGGLSLSAADLFETYKNSTQRQLFGSPGDLLYSGATYERENQIA